MRYLLPTLVLFFVACSVDPGPSASTDCPAGTAGERCEPCATGYFCDGESPAEVCAEGTWDDDADPASSCVNWTPCEPGSGYTGGSSTSDATCSPCATGTHSDGNRACEAWTTCVAGEEVLSGGSATTDRTCATCIVGTFSTTTNEPTCSLWTECGPDEFVSLDGSTTMDRQCALLEAEVGQTCTADSECAGNVCQRGYCKLPGFSVIPSGSFTQGAPAGEGAGQISGGIQRPVTITRAFFMQETEVTQAQWQASLNNNPSTFQSEASGNRPVETVSWWDAIAYMNALSLSEGLQQCYVVSGCSGTAGVDGFSCDSITFDGLDCEGYRLPTEAEWEYAARAGTTTSTYVSNHNGDLNCDANELLSSIAWWCANAGSSTHEVGGKAVNPWGLYDMIGNVSEWTWDWYANTYPAGPVTDPTGPTTGIIENCPFVTCNPARINRGCAFSSGAGFCRAATRNGPVSAPASRSRGIGFRAARSIPRSLNR